TLPAADAASEYRALHTGAVVGVVASVVSLFFPFLVASVASFQSAFPLVGLPIVSLAISLWAVSAIRNNREYFTGLRAAAVGAVVSAVSLFGGLGYGGYVYATEVPTGYARTSFLEMKPTDDDIQNEDVIPPVIQELRGKKVFIKGYMRPDSTKSRVNNTEFLLVRDSQQCCFGDLSQVAFFDQIQVTLTGGKTADLRTWVYRVGGELSWRPGRRAGEPPIVYSLTADYIK
ncbi:MAG: hypothetical protein AAGG46_10915, partial [Planctomycetota bacterium]